jgi:hypothetical protein
MEGDGATIFLFMPARWVSKESREAPQLALCVRTIAALDQDEEPECARSEAGSRRRMGVDENGAITAAGSSNSSSIRCAPRTRT